MLVCPRAASLLTVLSAVLTLAALPSAGCGKRNLQVGGTGQIGLDAGGGAAGGGGVAGSGQAATDGGLPDAQIHPPTDVRESDCVRTAILLPWARPAGTVGRLDVVVSGAAIAVTNRQGNQLDVRTYLADGSIIGGFQFGADTQFLPYRDGNFLLFTRSTTGDFSVTALNPNLVTGTRLHTASAHATEHMLGAAVLDTGIILLTDEHLVNVTAGRSYTWMDVLQADPFKPGRLYGLAAASDTLLVASGTNRALRLDVLDGSGGSLGVKTNPNFFDDQFGTDQVTSIPFGGGLLMFDDNPLRLTQIGFDWSEKVLGEHTQLLTFYRTAARVAATAPGVRPVAFWLTVFPSADNSQSITTHQLYGCELDVTAPGRCARAALIAETGLVNDVGQEPLAAAALPAASAFAVAHTDAGGRTWLRVADLSCAVAPTAP